MTSNSSSLACARSASVALCALLGACSSPDEPAAGGKPTYTLIDDMEGSASRIAWAPAIPASDALPGRWVSYADVQCEKLEPMPEWADGGSDFSYSALPEAHETLAGAVSEHAARLRTTAPMVNTWGAGMGFQFSEPPPGTDDTRVTRPCTNGADDTLDYPALPVDLREYSAIVFWAAADEAAGATTILVQFQDANTDPRGDACDPTPNSANACYNGFGVLLDVTSSLTRYEVDFSELEQDPIWGHRPKPSVLDAEHVYGLYFQVDTPGGPCVPPAVCLGTPTLAFDLWVDDLHFVKR